MLTQPEAWMRGPVEGVSPLLAPVLFTFQQTREELAHHSESLTTKQLWARPFGLASAGFHVLHMAGSTSRLMAYVQGRELTAEQLAALEAEKSPAEVGREELLRVVDVAFAEAERVVRGIDPATLADARWVGRRRLPTTVIGLLTHIAEHTQRHLGQAISACKLARAGADGGAEFGQAH